MIYQKKPIRNKQFYLICQLLVLAVFAAPLGAGAVDNKKANRWGTQWSAATSSSQGAYGNLFDFDSGKTYVVQCHYQSSRVFREIIKKAGAKIITYIPQETFIIQSEQKTVNTISGLSMVRWVEAFEPAYKINHELLSRLKERNLGGLGIQNRYLLSLYTTDETSLKEMGRFLEKVTGRYHHFNGKDFGVHLGDRELFKVISHQNIQFVDDWPSGVIALRKRSMN